MRPADNVTLPHRIIHLPLAFNDKWTNEAISRCVWLRVCVGASANRAALVENESCRVAGCTWSAVLLLLMDMYTQDCLWLAFCYVMSCAIRAAHSERQYQTTVLFRCRIAGTCAAYAPKRPTYRPMSSLLQPTTVRCRAAAAAAAAHAWAACLRQHRQAMAAAQSALAALLHGAAAARLMLRMAH